MGRRRKFQKQWKVSILDKYGGAIYSQNFAYEKSMEKYALKCLNNSQLISIYDNHYNKIVFNSLDKGDTK
jgi:hypothetical protein